MKQHIERTDVLTAQIDRLVAGDLPEPDRRSLLAWLDEDPRRWRACGLAFLEAQAWQQAAEGWPEAGVGGWVPEVRGQESEVRSQRSGFRIGPLSPLHWLAIAGLVLAAFTLGIASGRNRPAASPAQAHLALPSPAPHAPAGPLLATVSLRTPLGPQAPAQLTLPVTPVEGPPAAPAISDYERQRLERMGFELTEELRYLPAKLPDGRDIMVPVNKIHVRFKGTPVS